MGQFGLLVISWRHAQAVPADSIAALAAAAGPSLVSYAPAVGNHGAVVPADAGDDRFGGLPIRPWAAGSSRPAPVLPTGLTVSAPFQRSLEGSGPGWRCVRHLRISDEGRRMFLRRMAELLSAGALAVGLSLAATGTAHAEEVA